MEMPEATHYIRANWVRNVVKNWRGWFRECPVEVMFVSLGMQCMHCAYNRKFAERHDTFKMRHTNRKYECMDAHCIYAKIQIHPSQRLHLGDQRQATSLLYSARLLKQKCFETSLERRLIR